MSQHDQIRDAATIILVRDAATQPRVLMGQRGAGAIFMPGKFVFPGGSVDPADHKVPLAEPLPPGSSSRLCQDSSGAAPECLAVAAIRELWEETGQILGQRGDWPAPPKDWSGFAASGHRPAADALSFVFRAITPPGRPRRFDARFFLAPAEALRTDPDDFSRASGELAHLQWVPLADARAFDLPFITTIVLSELAARLPDLSPPDAVPFFSGNDEEMLYRHLRGAAPGRAV